MSTWRMQLDNTDLENSGGNITVRRYRKDKAKMALTATNEARSEPHGKGSLFIDSILSSSELDDVQKMLKIENNLHLDFFTSTQMGRKHREMPALNVSPIIDRSCDVQGRMLSNRFSVLGDQQLLFNYINEEESSPVKGIKEGEEKPNCGLHATLDGSNKKDGSGRAPDDTLSHDNGEREGGQGSGAPTTAGMNSMGTHMPGRTVGRALDSPVPLVPGEMEGTSGLQGSGGAGANPSEPPEEEECRRENCWENPGWRTIE